jgi:WD40 repeat protein
LVGYTDGSIKIMEFKNFEVQAIFKFDDLKTNEELTACTWCPNAINFAVGTSHGSVYLCSFKPLTSKSSSQSIIKAIRLNGVSRPEPDISSAVTGILLSSFDPEGSMVVAFANGEIRTWQASSTPEVFKTV